MIGDQLGPMEGQPEQPPADCHRSGAPKVTQESIGSKNTKEFFKPNNAGEPFELKNIQESCAEEITQVKSPFEPNRTQDSFVPFESYHSQEAFAETAQKDDKKEDQEEAINEFDIIYPYWDEDCGLLDNDE